MFDVLRPSQSWDIGWSKAVTHSPTHQFSIPLGLVSEDQLLLGRQSLHTVRVPYLTTFAVTCLPGGMLSQVCDLSLQLHVIFHPRATSSARSGNGCVVHSPDSTNSTRGGETQRVYISASSNRFSVTLFRYRLMWQSAACSLSTAYVRTLPH